jgi:hypothetical protein
MILFSISSVRRRERSFSNRFTMIPTGNCFERRVPLCRYPEERNSSRSFTKSATLNVNKTRFCKVAELIEVGGRFSLCIFYRSDIITSQANCGSKRLDDFLAFRRNPGCNDHLFFHKNNYSDFCLHFNEIIVY